MKKLSPQSQAIHLRPQSEHCTKEDSQALQQKFSATSGPENVVTAKDCSMHLFYKQINRARHCSPSPKSVVPLCTQLYCLPPDKAGAEGKGMAQYLTLLFSVTPKSFHLSSVLLHKYLMNPLLLSSKIFF